jgi:mRNA-degrading endonuclease RelE of RelBE toxin-antitoxin system
MRRRARFALVYATEVYDHLDSIETKYHRLIRETLKEQLSRTPTVKTRNRKPLEEPTEFGATWELRFGPNNAFRVFYQVAQADKTVTILAIGVKEGNRLFISGQEFIL